MPKAKERSGKKSFSRPSLPPFFTVPQKGGETIHQTHTAAQPSAVALVSQHGTHRAIEAVFATSTVPSAKHWMREIMDFFGEITDP